MAARIDPPVNFHGLRHTDASRLAHAWSAARDRGAIGDAFEPSKVAPIGRAR